jgi:hypothetical protein
VFFNHFTNTIDAAFIRIKLGLVAMAMECPAIEFAIEIDIAIEFAIEFDIDIDIDIDIAIFSFAKANALYSILF